MSFYRKKIYNATKAFDRIVKYKTVMCKSFFSAINQNFQ